MDNLPAKQPLTEEEITKLVDNIVLGGVAEGASLRQIEITVEKKSYTEADKRKILEKVRDSLEEAANLDPEVVKGTCIVGMQNLYKKLYETGDYPNAIKALERLFKMTNTEVNEKVYPEEEKEQEEQKDDETEG